MLIKLRGWQILAKKKWGDSGFRGCISVATGGGKTIFALSCYQDLKSQYSDLRILVMVPTIALLDQWYDAFSTDLGIGIDKIKILVSGDLNPNAEFNLVVLNSARRISDYDIDTENLFLVVDECHRSASPANARALEVNARFTLGLSATPFREYDSYFSENVEPKLGPVIYEYSLKDAMADGILSQLKVTNIRVPLNAAEAADYEKLTKSAARAFAAGHEESGKMILVRRARISNNAQARVPTVISLLSSYRSERVIVFFESIAELNRAANLLKLAGHHFVLYHSQVPDFVRRANLKLFRKGAYDILLTCRALDEGFNVPEASIAVIAAGTASQRQRTQRMGRVLRAIPGKGEGRVITLYATDDEESRLVKEIGSLGLESKSSWLKVNT